MQSAVHSITTLFVDTPVCGLLKIVWCVMLVLCLDCLRNVFKSAGASSDPSMANAQMFEAFAAKEGALVLALNLASMMAIQALHITTGRCAKLELDRDVISRQAKQAGEFAKTLMAEGKEVKKTPETKMPEESKTEQEGELRKRFGQDPGLEAFSVSALGSVSVARPPRDIQRSLQRRSSARLHALVLRQGQQLKHGLGTPCGLAAVALLISREIGGYDRPDRFVIVTSPSTRNVLWAPLPSLHDLTLPVKDRWIPDAQILIDGKASKCWGWTCSEHSDRGLEEPTGLALYQRGGGTAWLYISDPKVGFLYRYEVRKPDLKKITDAPTVQWEDFLPDLDNKLGSGAYGEVYPVRDSPHLVMKIFQRADWSEIQAETYFARVMKSRFPSYFVDCLGVGSVPGKDGSMFAVFERAFGKTLDSAAHRFRQADGIRHVSEALATLEELLSAKMHMMHPDESGNLHIHVDLKPDNIMYSTESGAAKLTLIDYGLIRSCPQGDAEAESSALQLLRWFGWQFLWMLASEAFSIDNPDKNPWQQLPDGFKPFFQPSDLRPSAYRSQNLTPELLSDALRDGFFDEVMSAPFRKQWTSAKKAKAQMGKMLGDLFYAVAWASDCKGPIPDFTRLKRDIAGLRALPVSSTWRGLQADSQQLVASDLKDSAHWLAVDSYGNLFYTDAKAGVISMISSEDMSKGIPKGRTLASSEKLKHVAGPAGIAVDAMDVYWANLKGDQKKGTLLKAGQVASGKAKSATILSGTSDMYQAMVKDVCLAGSNVFFTGDGESLFAVKADGSGNVTEVARLQQPRGCAYDKENTLFVAGATLWFRFPPTWCEKCHEGGFDSGPSPNRRVLWSIFKQILAASADRLMDGGSVVKALARVCILACVNELFHHQLQCSGSMGATSKGCDPCRGDRLIHDLSTCSTQVRDPDLAEGSLSQLVSVDDERGGLEGGGSIVSVCSSTVRQPLVLLQLRRLAPKGGHLSQDGKKRVHKESRHYELLVEPGRQSLDVHGSSTFLEPGGPGYMPWLRSLRPKKASALRTRQQAAPLQLVNLLPRSPNKPKPCKARRTRAPRLVQEHSKHDKQTTLRLDQGPEEHEADPFEFALSRASSGSLDLALPATLDEDMTHKASIEVATWPLGPAIESRMRPKQHGAEESKSQSLRPGKLKGASLQFPSRSFDLRESTFMDDRDRSWFRASSSISNFDRPRGKSAGFLNQRSQVREMVSAMMKTMTTTFPRSVWDECGFVHPEEEMEMVRAAEAKVVEEQLGQLKGLVVKMPALRKGRSQRKSDAQSNRRRSFGIVSDPRTTPQPTERLDEKVLAHLAKQTGWSVLDVEEVWDVFCTYAVGGRISVQGPDFVSLVQDLYDGVTDDEVMLLQQHISAVRKRHHARSRFLRRGMTGLGLDNLPERSDVRFSEFYVALVKWLDL
ncbi:unnamed protein product, partial [Symbiodinium microadriaticum]